MKCQATLSDKDLLIPDGYPEIIFLELDTLSNLPELYPYRMIEVYRNRNFI